MLPSQPAPAERFATILLWLSKAVVTRSHFGLSPPLIALIIGRLREIGQRVARLAARIREGRYAPRRSAPRSPGVRHPRQPNPLPVSHGWLLQLVPEAIGYRSQLEYLLRDPETAALLAAAPAALGRPLRSLCRMLRLDPPEILAPPAKPRPPRQTFSAAIPATPPTPTPRRKQWSLARIRGSPRPA